ncbi:MAG: HAD-IA family hydrolase [Chloroflexi bacterium]|nr:HAD-IA family hydrolase [Chloroflexota bacterium]
MIKAVFFDLYGTLAGFDPPREQVQTQALGSFGFTATKQGIARGYVGADDWMSQVNASDTPVPRLQGQARDRFFAEYQRLIMKGAGIEVDMDTAGQVWAKVQQIPYSFAAFDDSLPVLDMLKLRELTLGLISNIGRDVDEMCESLGLAPYLDFIVTSTEVGIGKPHPPVFLKALERAGVAPDEAIHVGDSYRSDVQGARGVGIRPLLLDRDGVMTDVTDCPRIGSLMEVLDYLDSPGGFAQ